MSNVFTLDSLREEVEREFAPVTIALSDTESVTLRNVLRLPKKEREEVFALLDQLDAVSKEEDTSGITALGRSAELALEMFVIVADNKKLGQKLVNELKDDLASTLRLMERWMEATQPGEADGSLT